MPFMRLLVLAIATTAFVVGPAHAGIHYFPWCAHVTGAGLDGAVGCAYATRDQCLADVSGVGGFCEPNTRQPGRTSRAAPARQRPSSR
jgi:hypothetical protein